MAKGNCIGWTDADNLYLEPMAAYAAAQEFARSTGEPLAVSEISLNKRLHEKHLLATVDKNRDTLTVRRTIQRANRKVLHMKVSVLLGDVGFRPDDVSRLAGFPEKTDNGLGIGSNHLQQIVGFVGSNPGEKSPGEIAADGNSVAGGQEVIEI